MSWFTEGNISSNEQADACDLTEFKSELKDLRKTISVQESSETADEAPELEDKNFRVTDNQDRKEVIDEHGIRLKVNPERDIREYVEGKYKGEQLFAYKAAIRETEKAGKKLPATKSVYTDIINQKYNGKYQDFLVGEKIKFTGRTSSCGTSTIAGCDEIFLLYCADESTFAGNKEEIINGNNWAGKGIRCLKDKPSKPNNPRKRSKN